ncbi:hypothetical protein MCAV_07930 [[Mycoplasma] cavipharyngis]|uniref:MSC_0882 family membrane protein n=1 Tax=[Mycoplasma] cavipharyngis TaxID=92757 RepID=UPI003703CB13
MINQTIPRSDQTEKSGIATKQSYHHSEIPSSSIQANRRKDTRPIFYVRAFHVRIFSCFIANIVGLAATACFILLCLAIFYPSFDLRVLKIQLDLNSSYWPILLPFGFIYGVIIWIWINNIIIYSGFAKENAKVKETGFPSEPTYYVKRTYVLLRTGKNSLAWLAAAVYVTLVLSVILIFIAVFAINSWYVGGQKTLAESAKLVTKFSETDTGNFGLRTYLIIIGIIATIFLFLHVIRSLWLKSQIMQLEAEYGGPDKILDPQYLANKLKATNRRNMIIFACYIFVLIISFVLLIKLPRKLFPKFSLKDKILAPFK